MRQGWSNPISRPKVYLELAPINKKGGEHSQKENHENAKHLSNQPAIARHSRPVLQQLSLSALYVVYHILRIRVDPLDHFTLLRYHRR